MRKWTGFFLTVVGFFLFFAALSMTVVGNLGTDAELYLSLQMENGLPQDANLTEAELLRIDSMLAGYLSGDESALDQSPFNARELAHMRDVFNLFARLRTLRNASLAAAVILIALGGILARFWRIITACILGIVLFIVPLAALGVWAAVDFTAAFTRFHQILFDNTLWQLDVNTDLLLQICPERFFSDFAALIALRTGLYIFSVPLAIAGIRIGRKFA